MATRLTDKAVERLRVQRQPYFVWDAGATGLGLKITPTGKRMWVLQLVYPEQSVQTKRSLGVYPGLSLAAARTKAAEWYAAVKQGVDPREIEAEQRRAAEKQRIAKAKEKENTFAAVAER